MSPDTAPRFPTDRGGVAILGAGTIAQSAHLPAYEQYAVGVVGVWSRSPATTATVRDRFPFVGRVYASAEELLADPEVRIVDLATGPEGRLDWIEAAIDAGKHVLAQKPLTLSAADLARLPALLDRAAAAGVRVAVNHNGRWAPPWRAASLLIRDGAIGEIVGVTHLHDKPLPPLAGTPFDDVPHMLLTDYLLHWVDITRGWLADGGAGDGAPGAGRRRAGARTTRRGAQPVVRDARRWPPTRVPRRPCGSPAATSRRSPAARSGCTAPPAPCAAASSSTPTGSSSTTARPAPPVELSGAWFVDGFAAAMGELMCAVAEDREPENSAADAARSVAVVLAARESAERGGTPVEVSA